MGLQIPSLAFCLASFLFLLVVLKILQAPKVKLPPAPWKLPLIGNIHQLISSLPHRKLRDLAKKYGPLMHLQLGEISTIIVSSPEFAKEVMKTHDIIFAHRPQPFFSSIMTYNSTDIIFSSYGNHWRQLRRICTMQVLSLNRVQSFRSIREEEVSTFIRTLYLHDGKSPVNLSEKIMSLIYGIIVRSAFGNKCKAKEHETFISLVKESTKLASGVCLADLYPSSGLLKLVSGLRPKLEKLHQKGDRVLANIIDDHRQKRNESAEAVDGKQQDDLVDVLLRLQQDGDPEFNLTDDNIKAVIQDIFGAGSDTSSTVVEWAMSEMLRNPRVMKEAQTEVRRIFDAKGNVDEEGLHHLKYLKSVIKETLRLHPPAPLLVPRECSESCVVGGYEIPAKSRVIINFGAIGRDPSYWNEAEKFMPERFLESPIDFRGTDFKYIRFGAGRRICPGISFALPNIELPLAQLLFHFHWKLPNGMKLEELDMDEAFGLTVRRKNDLLLIAILRWPIDIVKDT